MDEYNAVRMKLTAEMADSANLVKAWKFRDVPGSDRRELVVIVYFWNRFPKKNKVYEGKCVQNFCRNLCTGRLENM